MDAAATPAPTAELLTTASAPESAPAAPASPVASNPSPSPAPVDPQQAKRAANAERMRRHRAARAAKETIADVKNVELVQVAQEKAATPIKKKEATKQQIEMVAGALHGLFSPLAAVEMEGEDLIADVVNVAAPALAGDTGRKWAEAMAPLLALYLPENFDGPGAQAVIGTLVLAGAIGGGVMARRDERAAKAEKLKAVA